MKRCAVFLILISGLNTFCQELAVESPSQNVIAASSTDTSGAARVENKVQKIGSDSSVDSVKSASEDNNPSRESATQQGARQTTIQNAKENEIPVVLEQNKKSSSSDSPLLRMIFGLAIVGTLSAGALLYIKRNKKIKLAKDAAPEIKVLTQFYMGPKKNLAIVRVAGETILLGITDTNINLIKSLSLLDEDIPSEVPQSFHSVLEEDDFSITGIKDFVSTRLKTMRNLQ